MQNHPTIIERLVEHIKDNMIKAGETIVIKDTGAFNGAYIVRVEGKEYSAEVLVDWLNRAHFTTLDKAVMDMTKQLKTVRPKEEDPEPEKEKPVSKNPDMLYFLVHFKSVDRDGSAPYEGRAVVKSESYPTGSMIEAWERQLQWRHGAKVVMVLSFTLLAKEESEASDV